MIIRDVADLEMGEALLCVVMTDIGGGTSCEGMMTGRWFVYMGRWFRKGFQGCLSGGAFAL